MFAATIRIAQAGQMYCMFEEDSIYFAICLYSGRLPEMFLTFLVFHFF